MIDAIAELPSFLISNLNVVASGIAGIAGAYFASSLYKSVRTAAAMERKLLEMSEKAIGRSQERRRDLEYFLNQDDSFLVSQIEADPGALLTRLDQMERRIDDAGSELSLLGSDAAVLRGWTDISVKFAIDNAIKAIRQEVTEEKRMVERVKALVVATAKVRG